MSPQMHRDVSYLSSLIAYQIPLTTPNIPISLSTLIQCLITLVGIFLLHIQPYQSSTVHDQGPLSSCLSLSPCKDRWLPGFPSSRLFTPQSPSLSQIRSPHLTDHLGDPWVLLSVNIILCIPKLETLCETWSNQWWVKGNNQFKWLTASDCVGTAQLPTFVGSWSHCCHVFTS